MTPIIEIDNIGKKYKIGYKAKHLSLAHDVLNFFSPSARKMRESKSDFWALRNVSFSINQGEAVGIIGNNGAGKSTLLKVLSRITPPTEGRIVSRGRVASLLEVGTGFHPELTGRENIFLNGAILGMSRKEIQSKFDEIVAFSETEKFLDTPVKRYSSGMYVRLAFAVAAHLEPEILIIDEVLAVGDVEFQKKCLGKMNDAAKSGRTVLFVSHNLAAVTQLCTKGIVLQKGAVVFDGIAIDAVEYYTQLGGGQDGEIIIRNEPVVQKDNEIATLVRVSIEDATGNKINSCSLGESMTVTFDLQIFEPIGDYKLSFIVKSSSGMAIYDCQSQDSHYYDGSKPGRYKITATFPKNKLYPGKYYVDEFWFGYKDGEISYVCQPIVLTVPENHNIKRILHKHKGMIYETPNWSQQISD